MKLTENPIENLTSRKWDSCSFLPLELQTLAPDATENSFMISNLDHCLDGACEYQLVQWITTNHCSIKKKYIFFSLSRSLTPIRTRKKMTSRIESTIQLKTDDRIYKMVSGLIFVVVDRINVEYFIIKWIQILKKRDKT